MSTTINVEGMSCSGCEGTVEEALAEVAGVSSVDADRESNTVSVEGDADVNDLVRAVEDAGYTAHA